MDLRIIQMKVIFTRVDLRMIQITDSDKKSEIIHDLNIRPKEKISCPNHLKIRSNANCLDLTNPKIRTFQKYDYPHNPIVWIWKMTNPDYPTQRWSKVEALITERRDEKATNID